MTPSCRATKCRVMLSPRPDPFGAALASYDAEWLEDAILQFERHAPSGVLHPQVQVRQFHACAQRNRTLRRVLGGVGKQVDEHLAHAHVVGAYERQMCGDIQPPLHLRRTRLDLHKFVEHLAQKGRGLQRLEVQAERADFRARQIEQVVDHVQQVLAAPVDILRVLQQLGGLQRLARRQLLLNRLAEPQDGIQRRAHLMADVGDQARFQLVGMFGGLARRGGFLKQVDIMDGDADLVGQQLQSDDFQRALPHGARRLQVQHADYLLAQLDGQHGARAHLLPLCAAPPAAAGVYIRYEGDLPGDEHLLQQPVLLQRDQAGGRRRLAAIQDQLPLDGRPAQDAHPVIVEMRAHQFADHAHQMAGIQQRRDLPRDFEADFQLGAPVEFLLPAVAHQVRGDIGNRHQFARGDARDVVARDQFEALLDERRHRSPLRGQVHDGRGFRAQLFRGRIDGGCQIALFHGGQRQRVAVQTDQHRMLVNGTQLAPGVARGQDDRIGNAEHGIDGARAVGQAVQQRVIGGCVGPVGRHAHQFDAGVVAQGVGKALVAAAAFLNDVFQPGGDADRPAASLQPFCHESPRHAAALVQAGHRRQQRMAELGLGQFDDRQAGFDQRLQHGDGHQCGDQRIQVIRQNLIDQVVRGNGAQVFERGSRLQQHQFIANFLVGVDDRFQCLYPVWVGGCDERANALVKSIRTRTVTRFCRHGSIRLQVNSTIATGCNIADSSAIQNSRLADARNLRDGVTSALRR